MMQNLNYVHLFQVVKGQSSSSALILCVFQTKEFSPRLVTIVSWVDVVADFIKIQSTIAQILNNVCLQAPILWQ